MRRLLLAVGLAGVIATPAAAGPPIIGTGDSAVAIASPATPAARTALRLLLRYEMLCAQPGRGPVLVTMPAALRVPAKIRPTAVLVNGKAAPSVQVKGHAVSVGLPPNSNVICRSFVPGILWISFTSAASLRNPSRAGIYAIRARVGSHSFVARLAIHR